jgi:integral membrane protein (TIGR01906 family)
LSKLVLEFVCVRQYDKSMRILEYIVGFVMSLALVLILLITAVEAVVYWSPDYFKSEYEKYDVTTSVEMEMEDLLHVTDEMMAYLRGDREELQVPTMVAGQSRGFFSAREIAHMADVKELFFGGMMIRRWAIVVFVVCFGWLFLRKRLLLTPKFLLWGILGVLVVCAVSGLIVATDFHKYFVIFHHIFFDNDLWLLDPKTDLLIRIVPQPFFVDTTLRIVLTFGGWLVAVLMICSFFVWRQRVMQRQSHDTRRTAA